MIGAVEQAIVARIAAANDRGALGYKLKTVGSYGNELDEGLEKITANFPAVWVVYRGEDKIERKGNGIWRLRMRWAIVAATMNRRNEKAARRGDAGNVGSYQILDDLKALLLGQTLGLEIQPLQPEGVDSLAQGRSRQGPVSIYALQLTADYIAELVEPAGPAEGLHDFAQIHADWDLPPHVTNPSVPLDPADPDADIADTTNLETS